jgi:Endoribonuclease GhoS
MEGATMSNYIVRVELHNASYNDYETLHAAMARAGFSRTITSQNGTVYHLPTAQYAISSAGDPMSILKAARHAADTTRKQNGVLVATTQSTAWIGLTTAA